MQYFTNADSGKAVKIKDLGTRTTITVSDAQGHVSRTYAQPASHYLQRLKDRGYQPATAEQYAQVRAALAQEHKFHFSPDLGRAIYAQLAA